MQDLLMLLMFLVGSTAVFLFVCASYVMFSLTYLVSGSRPARALRSFVTRPGDTGVWSPDEDGETKKVDD